MSRLFELAYYIFCLCLLANGQRLEETVDIQKYSKCGTETEAACIKPLCKEGMYTFYSPPPCNHKTLIKIHYTLYILIFVFTVNLDWVYVCYGI